MKATLRLSAWPRRKRSQRVSSLYVCNENSSWATVCDLYDRYGEEFVDKLSTRRVWDEEAGGYVADETKEGRHRVQLLALDDARSVLQEKIHSRFVGVSRLDNEEFFGVKQWHIKLTIEALKKGGDCRGCDCLADIDKFVGGKVCSNSGCLKLRSTFLTVYSDRLKCEARKCK